MFIWFSSHGGRPGMGCCGGSLLLLPLSFLLMLSGSNSGGMLLAFVVIAVLTVMFIIPKYSAATLPDEVSGKRKNDDYTDKPKRDEGDYVLGDDGEIIPANEDEAANRYRDRDTGL